MKDISVKPRFWTANARITRAFAPGSRRKTLVYLPASTCGASCTNCSVQMTDGKASFTQIVVQKGPIDQRLKVKMVAMRKLAGTTIICLPNKKRDMSISFSFARAFWGFSFSSGLEAILSIGMAFAMLQGVEPTTLVKKFPVSGLDGAREELSHAEAPSVKISYISVS